MDIRNIGNHGNVDRTGDGARRPQARRSDSEATPAVTRDDARISSAGRETAARVDQFADLARGEADEREAKVEAARQKLLQGELDGDRVLTATAKNLLDRGFLSA